MIGEQIYWAILLVDAMDNSKEMIFFLISQFTSSISNSIKDSHYNNWVLEADDMLQKLWNCRCTEFLVVNLFFLLFVLKLVFGVNVFVMMEFVVLKSEGLK